MRRLLCAALRRLRAAAVAMVRGTWEQVRSTVAAAWRDFTIIVTVLIMAAIAAEIALRIDHGGGLVEQLFGG